MSAGKYTPVEGVCRGGERPGVADRFYAKVVMGPNSCHQFIASGTINGYGLFWYGKSMVLAHRWAYEFHVAPIPDGLQIDHLCRNIRCVNPYHLEPVTPSENTRRGLTARQGGMCRNRLHDITKPGALRKRCNGYDVCVLCLAASNRKARRKYKDKMFRALLAPLPAGESQEVKRG